MEPSENLFKKAAKDPIVRLAAMGGAVAGGVLVVAVFLVFGDQFHGAPKPREPIMPVAAKPATDDLPPKAIVETVPSENRFQSIAPPVQPSKATPRPEPADIAENAASPRPKPASTGLAQAPKKPRVSVADLPGRQPLAPAQPATKIKQTETAKLRSAPAPLPPVHLRSGNPKIAIVIDDMGVDRKRSARAITLPGKVTLSFLPYARDLAEQANKASAQGHDIMLHVAMEPESTEVDPGPNVLLTGVPTTELQASLDWNLAQMTGYIGVNNHMGSRFTRDLAGMRLVMAALKARGVFFLDSVTSRDSIAGLAAREAGVPYTRRHIFIDHKDDAALISRQLKQIEALAKKQGFAVAIGHPRDLTLRALENWLPELPAKGFELIGVSGLFDAPDRPVAESGGSG